MSPWEAAGYNAEAELQQWMRTGQAKEFRNWRIESFSGLRVCHCRLQWEEGSLLHFAIQSGDSIAEAVFRAIELHRETINR